MTLEDSVKLEKQLTKFASPEEVKDYNIVIGISLSPDRANCSFAYKHDPLKIFEINNWNSLDANSQIPSEKKDGEDNLRFPTIIKDLSNEDGLIIGNKSLDISNPRSELNVYDLIFDHLSERDSLLDNFENLTVGHILSEFFKSLLTDTYTVIEDVAQIEKQNFLKIYSQKCEELDNKVTMDVIEENFTFAPNSCRYCVSGPLNEGYRQLIRKAFVDANIIQEDDPQDRLMFVSDAEAFGYSVLSTHGYENTFKYGLKYIICDLNYNFVNFALMTVDATQSTSSVDALISNEPDIKGWRPLEKIYHNYVFKNNPESQPLDLLQEFRKQAEQASLLFEGGERTEVFVPFMDTILACLDYAYKADDKINSSYPFGNLMMMTDFTDYFTSGNNRETIELTLNDEPLSKGAVARALIMGNVKVPSTAITDETQDEDCRPSADYEPVDPKAYDFIIGMDFGTTYSGCSYASTKKKEINPITDWPGNDKEAKTPSLLLYDNNTKKIIEKKWGNQAKHNKRKEQALLECFKLLIAPKIINRYYGRGNASVKKIKKENTFSDLKVKDILVAYIKKLNEAALKHIKKRETAIFRKLFSKKPKVKYILTVPCMWSEVAKTTMREVAVRAGLARNEDDITIITEPEAAALCFDDIIETLAPLESYFIVCDAGGGTVDLVTYVAGAETDNMKASIKQVGEGCGDLCGSNCINGAFASEVRNYFKPGEFVKMEEFLDFLKSNFEKGKRSFTGDSDVKISYLPEYKSIEKDLLASVDPKKASIDDGYFIIPCSEMKKLFKKSVESTIKLLDEEIAKTKYEEKRVKDVLLVGGFSQSVYLQNVVRNWCKENGINLLPISPKMVYSVSYGAVSFGLTPRLVTKRNAGQSYALLLEENRIKTFDYFIRQNDLIPTTRKSYIKKIPLNTSESSVVAIYSSETTANNRTTDNDFKSEFSKVVEIRLDKHNIRPGDNASIFLEYTPTGILCYVESGQNNFAFNSAAGKGHVYKLRYPGIRDDKDGMHVLKHGVIDYILSSRE